MTMDGDEMRKTNTFFWRNRYKIAVVCMLIAAVGFTGVYLYSDREKSETQKQQVAVKDTGQKEEIKNSVTAKTDIKEEDTEEPTARASAVIEPKSSEMADTETATIAKEDAVIETDTQTAETAAKKPAAGELHFDADTGLLWPVSGSVILDYSMDQTVYFTTLDQYKYNPAVIISGNVNDKVKAAASGKIVDISTNEVTGYTVTMDIGDGYTAIYGQLKEVPYETGAYVEMGNTIGFVSEPTKYFALEGSNLYFALQKDGEPVDPVEFFQ